MYHLAMKGHKVLFPIKNTGAKLFLFIQFGLIFFCFLIDMSYSLMY